MNHSSKTEKAKESKNLFRLDRLRRISEMEKHHFWFAGRRKLISRMLNRHFSDHDHILDLGCGTGSMLKLLSISGYDPVGMDLRLEGISATKEKNPRVNVVQGSALELPFGKRSFDSAIMLDLLEHVDDVQALKQLSAVINPGGVVLISVPAHSWLWSFRDQDAGHLRRYSRKQLEERLEAAGFKLVDYQFYQSLLFPLVIITRLIGKRRHKMRDYEDQPAILVNKLLRKVTDVELAIGKLIRFRWGTTIIAICGRENDV